jgi:hypothetical protein
MNGMNKRLLIFLVMSVIVLSLSACGRIRNMVPGIGSSNQPTREATVDTIGKETSDLLAALRGAGAKVEAGDPIEQPFFP